MIQKQDIDRIDVARIKEIGNMITVSRDEARQLIDEVKDEELMNALDEAQGALSSNHPEPQYIVLKIS